MRPLRLSLQGFTCFRDRAQIEFADLDLFAITGPTGAGKSSIVDAITYALYGRVPRLDGRAAKDLISQGLTGMTVTFEFAVGDAKYRILRTASRKGAARIQFESFDPADGKWRAEAGRVRDVGEHVQRLVGLDFEGFTRSVVLPQNQFHLFLAGEAQQRRQILTELLNLDVYNVVRARANELASIARADVASLESRLGEDFATATPEALAARRQEFAATSAAAEAGALQVRRLEEAARLAESAARLRTEEADAANRRAAAERRLEAAEALLANGEAAASSLATELDSVRGERNQTPFDATEYGRLQVAVSRSEELEEAVARLSLLRARAEKAQTDAGRAESARRAAAEAVEQAEAALAAARDRRETLLRERHADFVRERLRRGEPCPVCGQTVHELPPRGPKAPFEQADREMKSAEEDLARCRKTLAQAEAHAAGAASAAAQLARQVAEANEDVARRDQALAADTGLPREGRTEALRRRLAALEEARKLWEQLGERERDLAQKLEALRSGLSEAQASAAAARAEAEECSRQAADRAEQLKREEDALAAVAAESGWSEIADAARSGRDARTLVQHRLERARAALDEALGRQGALAHEVETIEKRIAQAAVLRKQLEGRRRDRDVASTLARLLQADRFQAYVQEEALRVLAQDGSARLEELSQGRYALKATGQEFEVVDHWNADEARPVKTLSGGETFLASLALALALAERLPDLGGGGGRSALESLFLDEGFGSLDADTLEVVAAGIEAMRSDNRVVGIITHIPELAERMPARIRVLKGQDGSRVQQE